MFFDHFPSKYVSRYDGPSDHQNPLFVSHSVAFLKVLCYFWLLKGKTGFLKIDFFKVNFRLIQKVIYETLVKLMVLNNFSLYHMGLRGPEHGNHPNVLIHARSGIWIFLDLSLHGKKNLRSH